MSEFVAPFKTADGDGDQAAANAIVFVKVDGPTKKCNIAKEIPNKTIIWMSFTDVYVWAVNVDLAANNSSGAAKVDTSARSLNEGDCFVPQFFFPWNPF